MNTSNQITQLINQAVQLGQNNDLTGAERLLRQALKLDPNNPNIAANLATALEKSGKIKEAEAILKRAVEISPNHPGILGNLGSILIRRGEPRKAEALLRKSLLSLPNHPGTLTNLAGLLVISNKAQEAEKLFVQAMQHAPGHVDALLGLANIKFSQLKFEEASQLVESILRLDPNNVDALNAKAALLREKGFCHEAILLLDTSLKIKPNSPSAKLNRGLSLVEINSLENAITDLKDALRLNPESGVCLDALISTKRKVCNWDGLEHLEKTRKNKVKTGQWGGGTPNPMGTLYYSSSNAQEQKTVSTIGIRKLCDMLSPAQSAPQKLSNTKLHIGFMLADARDHPNGYNIVELLKHFDRDQLKIITFSWGQDDKSNVRAQIVKNSDTFIDLFSKSDKAIEDAIHSEKIDILVDLMGHTRDNRFSVLATKPAPIQVNYLGYPGTSGADFIDYIIGDEIITPISNENDFSEKIVQLPYTYQANNHRTYELSSPPDRASLGLPNEVFIFACLNNPNKLSKHRFNLWMRILKKCESSVLWLYAPNKSIESNLINEAKKSGIPQERLVFAPKVSRIEHLNRIQVADLFLDTDAYGAHTTASDFLWAGVPVLTSLGNTFASRVTASLLRAANMKDLIVNNTESYIEKAIYLATNAEQSRAIKEILLKDRYNLPLFDMNLRAQDLGNAFKTMKKLHDHNLPVRHILVNDPN